MTLTDLKYYATVLPADLDVPNITPDYSPAPVQAGLKLTNQVLAFGTLGLFVAMIAIGLLLAFAGLDSTGRTRAWKALAICALAAMFMGSISGAMTFFGNIALF
ncbi:MAG: hypothetical protein ACK5LO_13650 [Leucobacter sp.]